MPSIVVSVPLMYAIFSRFGTHWDITFCASGPWMATSVTVSLELHVHVSAHLLAQLLEVRQVLRYARPPLITM